MLAALDEVQPSCEELTCQWVVPAFLSAGTPIFKSSGYAHAWDFGLSLVGLTTEQLREEPGYGHSITPWQVGSGSAVCPLAYFHEPLRSEYMELMGNFTCGPFNQDVPGTAMGFWLPTPSPVDVPKTPREREVDEWETVWLFHSQLDRSMHTISVGNNTFGLDYGQYGYSFVSDGQVNVRWDRVEPGATYCSELRALNDFSEFNQHVAAILLIRLAENPPALILETINAPACGGGHWEFSDHQRTFYR